MKQRKDVPTSKKSTKCPNCGSMGEVSVSIPCPACMPNVPSIYASAPALLEAAKIISGWVERVAEEVTMGPDDQKALNNLRMAIAKAEGGK